LAEEPVVGPLAAQLVIAAAATQRVFAAVPF